uniref:Glycosyl transferase family 2 n=1 Tax=Geobacter sp. (strain M21) TaxID=443144 RepID=C6E5J8_GEOSM
MSRPQKGPGAPSQEGARIAVVIPSYKVKQHVLQVISAIGPEVSSIVVVDDACPDGSGRYVEENCRDPRVLVCSHTENRGVGGATLTGYQAALDQGADIIVKLDGDGQMDPALIPKLVRPIVDQVADYSKGNRFYSVEDLQQMPFARLVGNSVLSFMAKFSTGYWTIFDPTNGFTAIHGAVAALLPLEKIEKRYFFESDMLFRLNTLRAVVADVPMRARYADEKSNLSILGVIPEFLRKHAVNSCKRIFYNYYLRDFSAASVEVVLGLCALLFGVVFGSWTWYGSIRTGVPATSGTVMLAALPTMLGMQLFLAFLSYDTANAPKYPLHRRL